MKQAFLQDVRAKAQKNPARIVFPETFDERTMAACARIVKEKLAHPVLLGEPSLIQNFMQQQGIVNGYSIIDYEHDEAKKNAYTEALYRLRRDKGITQVEAKKLIENLNYFAVMVVQQGDAEGLITGANAPGHDTLRPALQIIKTKERFHKVSGFFFMVLPDRLLIFADCMVNPEPNSYELAEIAIDTARTARRFGIEPRIAMLSFSTAGSASYPSVDRVREATKMVNARHPELFCEGEMQVDAALVPAVCAKKMPESKIKGTANILIFPNLDAANIAYKLVERLAGAAAVGPILQGLSKPVNDLSRGCSVEDIVNLSAITSVEVHEMPFYS